MPQKSFFIFDLDGTLFDTVDDLTPAVNYALQFHGIRTLPEDSVRFLVGNGSLNLIRRSLGDTVIAPEIVHKTFLEYYTNHCTLKTRPMPGVLDFLADTTRRMALLTNKPDAPTRRILEHFGLTSRFESVLCGDTSPARKPAPEGFLKIMNDAHVAKADVIMVGDDTPDILGAQAAGIDSVFIQKGYGKLDPNSTLSPTYSIPHFSDLLNLGIL